MHRTFARGNITLVTILALALVAALIIIGSQASARLATLAGSLETLGATVTALDEKLARVAGEADALRRTLSSEQQSRLEEEEERLKTQEELEGKLTTLASDVSGQLKELESADISLVVARWKPYVYKVSCDFTLSDGDDTSGGSATIETKEGTTRFITNEHVLEKGGVYPDRCTLSVPGSADEISVAGEVITIADDEDVGYGVLSQANVLGITSEQFCAGAPAIGDPVVILGYPAIGGKESITATEGIVSGFDDGYYTTSAKIEKGNSGGAAIDVKRDCFLGLPTLVIAGRIESLARILPL